MLEGYIDANLVGDVDSRKSTSEYLTTFVRGAVSWQSKVQMCVALSTTEAEYIVVTKACKEILWMKKWLQKLGMDQERYVLKCDNQSAICLAKNSTFHFRTKHIEIRYRWIREVLQEKKTHLDKVYT